MDEREIDEIIKGGLTVAGYRLLVGLDADPDGDLGPAAVGRIVERLQAAGLVELGELVPPFGRLPRITERGRELLAAIQALRDAASNAAAGAVEESGEQAPTADLLANVPVARYQGPGIHPLLDADGSPIETGRFYRLEFPDRSDPGTTGDQVPGEEGS